MCRSCGSAALEWGEVRGHTVKVSIQLERDQRLVPLDGMICMQCGFVSLYGCIDRANRGRDILRNIRDAY